MHSYTHTLHSHTHTPTHSYTHSFPSSSAVDQLRSFHRLPTAGFEQLDAALPGRPYEWAQSLSGKYALPSHQITEPSAEDACDSSSASAKKSAKKSAPKKPSSSAAAAAGMGLPQMQVNGGWGVLV